VVRHCVRAKALLDARGISYEEVSLEDDPQFRRTLLDRTGGWTVPQILIDGRPIGGYAELYRLDRSGALAETAEGASPPPPAEPESAAA
jgi:glutaredoxin 3